MKNLQNLLLERFIQRLNLGNYTKDYRNNLKMKIYREIANEIITARENKKIQIEEVAKILNISRSLLEDIESGNFKKIKENVYELGHLRTYINWLKINPQPIMDLLKNTNNSNNTKSNFFTIPFLNINKNYVIGISLALLILLFFSWHKFYLVDTNIKNIAENNSIEYEDVSNKNTILINNNSAENKEKNNSDLVAIKAITSSWIQIERLDGSIYTSKILKKDEQIELLNKKNLFLVTNNAGGLVISINGLVLEKLGNIGDTQRNISLNPKDLIKKNNN